MIAVSSFSLRSVLGPLRLDYRDAEGRPQVFEVPYPASIGFGDFARRVRDDLGVTAVELCQIQLGALTVEEAHVLRRELDDAGVTVLTMPIDIGDLAGAEDAERERDLAATERWMDLASILGCTFVRANAGSPFATAAPVMDVLVDSFTRLADAAEARGLQLLVENHGGSSSDPAFLLALRDRVGADRLGILLDLGNFEPALGLQRAAMTGAHVDDEPDFTPLYEGVARLAPVARLVHAKAYGFDGDGAGRPLDTARTLRIVRDAGYAGPISIEWEGESDQPWADTARVLQLVRESGFTG